MDISQTENSEPNTSNLVINKSAHIETSERPYEAEYHVPKAISAAEIQPSFLTRTRTKEEKENMREQFRKQEANKEKSPYAALYRIYAKFSTSFLLENKAATARDHLANERTFLAWLRTSLSLITVGVAITQLYHLAPAGESNKVSHAKAGKSLGATFVIFSILFLYFANARYFHTQIAMTKGHFPASRGAVAFGSACVFAVLIAMFIVIILDIN